MLRSGFPARTRADRKLVIPDREEVDHRAGDDLVHDVADRQDREDPGQQAADDDGGDHAEPRVGGDAGDDRRGEGAREQHPLDRDVDDAGPLAEDARERAEGDRHRPEERSSGRSRRGSSTSRRRPR